MHPYRPAQNLLHLTSLVLTGETLLLRLIDCLMGKTIRLPFGVFMEDKCLDSLFIVCSDACIRSFYRRRKHPLVVRITKNGFLTTQCLVELGGHHPLRFFIRQDNHDGGLTNEISYLVGGNTALYNL